MQWVQMRMRVAISSNSPHCSQMSSRRSPVILQTARHSASAHGAPSTGQKLMVTIAVMTIEDFGSESPDSYRTAGKSAVRRSASRCRRDADMHAR
jgi:hypothetical protein